MNQINFPSDYTYYRPRLNALFDKAFQKKLVVVHAGAGFGKSTAVMQYLSNTNYHMVWFLFSEQDNVPLRFWEHLTRVFSEHRPKLGEKMKHLGFPESSRTFDLFVSDFAEELYQDAQTIALIFDDTHLISEAHVLTFLSDFISAQFENCTIVLITRTWPLFEKLPLALSTIPGVDDLRFTPDETMDYLNAAGLHLDKNSVETIYRYVAGWPIALSLLRMILKQENSDEFDQSAFSVTKPSLFSLFEQAIFSQYSPTVQNILVNLSVLDSFPRGLVVAVSGQPQGALSQVLSNNVFIKYNPDSKRMFFHPLFQEFLREKRWAMEPDVLKKTYRKAANWCFKNGHYYDAASYYRQSDDFEALWNTLLRIEAVRHKKSERDFFIEQIKLLPTAFKQTHPMTYILLAALYINAREFAEAATMLDTVEKLLKAREASEETQSLLGEYNIVCGFLALYVSPLTFAKYFEQAAALLPSGSYRWGAKLLAVDSGPALNLQSALPGAIEESLAVYTKAAPYITQLLHGAGAGMDKLCQCEALFLSGALKKAAEFAYQAFYAAQVSSQVDIQGNTLFILLRIYMALGNYEQIQDVLSHIDIFEKSIDAQKLDIWDIAHGWFFSTIGEVERVAAWIRNPVLMSHTALRVDRPILVRLRCLLMSGQYAEALALASQFEETDCENVLTKLYVNLSRAVIYDHLGDLPTATSALKEFYSLASGNRLYMIAIEFGNRTRLLFEHIRQSKNVSDFPEAWLNEIQTKASTYAKRAAYISGRYRQEQGDQADDYNLSPRETELLVNLSHGLTRDEIGVAMQLSINTVKSMTKQMFLKLGAVNAADAVRIAIVNQLI